MTVENIVPIITAVFTGPGNYTFAFSTHRVADLIVKHLTDTGIFTSFEYLVDYTVVLNSESEGGTITVLNEDMVGGYLRISRVLPFSQEIDLVNAGPLDVETLEQGLDRGVMLLQQMNTQLASALQATEWRGDWVTAVEYNTLNVVVYQESWYVVTTPHTSGVFATDFASGKLAILLDVSNLSTMHDEVEDWHTEIDAWQAQTALDAISCDADALAASGSAIDAAASADDAAAAAAAAAAAVDLPVPGSGDVGKPLVAADPHTDGFEIGAFPVLITLEADAAVLTTGGVMGFNLSKTGDNELTVQPGSCLDSELAVSLVLGTADTVTIPSVANTIYHVFAVKLVVGGSIEARAYTTEAGVDSDSAVSAYRWVGFCKTTATSVIADFVMYGDCVNFLVPSQNYVATFLSVTTYTFLDISSFVPLARVESIQPFARESGGTASQSTFVFISTDGTHPTVRFAMSTYGDTPTDTNTKAWGSSNYDNIFLPPLSNGFYHKKVATNITYNLGIRSLKLRR